MNRLLPLICVLAGVVVGTVAGMALWTRDSDASKIAAAPESGRNVETARPPQESAQPAPKLDTAALLAGLELAPVGSKDAFIQGTVRLEDGRPLAGVEVRATPWIAAGQGASSTEGLEAFARRRSVERARESSARTDETGTYRLSGLDGATRYTLSPGLAGYDIRPERGATIMHYAPGGGADFIATAGGKSALKLRLPGGHAPDAAYIEVGGKDGKDKRFWEWTFDKPFVPVRVGTWTVNAKAGEFQEYGGECSCEVFSGQPAPDLEIELGRRYGMVGTVVPAVGQTDRLELRLVEEVEGKFPDPSDPGAGTRRTVTSALAVYNGWTFGFLDLKPGRYQLCVHHGQSLVMTHEQVVAEDCARLRLVVPEPLAKDHIVVRVRGPDGPVTEGVAVYLIFAHPNGSEGGGDVVLNRGGGEYWMPRNNARLKSVDWFYELQIRTPFGARSLRYQRNDSHVVDVAFVVPATVIVEIPGFDSFDNRQFLRVSCAPLDPPPGEARAFDRREDRQPGGSTRRFDKLIPGRYQVELYMEVRGRGDRRDLESKVIDIVSGDNHVQLAVPTLHSITVVIPEEYRKQQLGLYGIEDTSLQIHQPKMGVEEQVFENLKPGDYRLQSNPGGVMKVTVPLAPGQKVTFAPQAFNAYRLVATPQPAKVDLGFQDGDMVVEIDSVTLADNFEKRHDLISASAQKESTTWVVMRAGRRVSVTFDGRKWHANGLHGEPARLD